MQTSSRRFILLLIGLVSVAGGGCATDRVRSAQTIAAPAATQPGSPADRPPDRFLSLDDIPDRPELAKLAPAATAPTSQPTTRRAPIEALSLYAQAMNALRTGRRFTAINLLEKALALDPHSFELNHAIGRARALGRGHDPQSIAALERAAAIKPDHLELQTDLGRQYTASGDTARALRHLRLALQTAEYQSDASDAAVADLFLARALQEGGYDRAALEQYATLLRRVQGRTLSARSNPQLAFLISDRLYVDIGDLYARNGQFEDALAAYEPAARRDPSDFGLEAKLVRALVGLKRFEDASRRAADVVVRFRASKPSLDLLREVHAASGDGAGGRPGAADELARMLADRPADTAILFALVELLKEDGRWAAAEGHLAAAAERAAGDTTVLRRWLQLRLDRDDPEGAARLLIESTAMRPDLSPELEELWRDVTSPARTNRLRLAQLQTIAVLPWQSPAKELAVASVAENLNRDAVAAQALRRAVNVSPPFAPAFREQLGDIWGRRGLDEAEKVRLSDELVAAAASDTALAHELRGLALLARKRDKEAADALGQAIAAAKASASPSLLMSYAVALRGAGEKAKFEQLMWKLLSDRPTFEDAYGTLYAYYSQADADGQADRVLNTWLTAAPYSVPARLLQAARHARAGRPEATEQMIAKLLDERPDDREVIGTAYAFHSRTGKTDTLVEKLEQHASAKPGSLAAVGALVELYREKDRAADAGPLLDAARAALADDPDHLYQLAHLYAASGNREGNEGVLRQVLSLEPSHPPASNDLGYTWAERGEHLAEAESLIRQAVEAEPTNASFLDSLGWVLYKRGRFAEARVALEKSVSLDAARADPVVLDHLGDALYRLGDRNAAAKRWEQAGARIAERGLAAAAARDDLKQLKADLDRKARQLKSGEPVTVAPVIDEARQAKN